MQSSVPFVLILLLAITCHSGWCEQQWQDWQVSKRVVVGNQTNYYLYEEPTTWFGAYIRCQLESPRRQISDFNGIVFDLVDALREFGKAESSSIIDLIPINYSFVLTCRYRLCVAGFHSILWQNKLLQVHKFRIGL